MDAKPGSANPKPPDKGKATSGGTKSLGPVPNLEEHVNSEWWRQIFNSTYLKTDGDVVDDLGVTAKEVDAFCEILKLQKDQRLLDVCCGQGPDVLELARRGFANVEGLARSHI
jgi:D-alanine-D-alanine ligase